MTPVGGIPVSVSSYPADRAKLVDPEAAEAFAELDSQRANEGDETQSSLCLLQCTRRWTVVRTCATGVVP